MVGHPYWKGVLLLPLPLPLGLPLPLFLLWSLAMWSLRQTSGDPSFFSPRVKLHLCSRAQLASSHLPWFQARQSCLLTPPAEYSAAGCSLAGGPTEALIG